MEVGCYVLHLYCANGGWARENSYGGESTCPREDPNSEHWRSLTAGEFTGDDKAQARKQARAAGWVLKGGRWTCPACVLTNSTTGEGRP